MHLRQLAYVPMSLMTSDRVGLYQFAALNERIPVESIIKLIQYLIIFSGTALAIFGILLFVCHFKEQHPRLQKRAHAGLTGIVIAMIYAYTMVGIVLVGTVGLFGSSWIEIAVGGFIHTIVTDIANAVSHKFENLSAPLLVRLAWIFIVVGWLIIIVVGIVIPLLSPS